MTETPVSDESFWRIVREDDEFIRRFYGRVHPLYDVNGGISFHNPEKLTQLLTQAQRELTAGPKFGMTAWTRRNRISVVQDWLTQVQWIFEHAAQALTRIG